MPSLVGQDNLFKALQAELDYVNLIRNIVPMWWNWKVQFTSNIPWIWPYTSILKLGHDDLPKDLSCED